MYSRSIWSDTWCEVRSLIPAYNMELLLGKYGQQGKWIVAIQNAINHLEYPHFGYSTKDDRFFSVLERSPNKKRLKAEQLVTTDLFDETLTIMGTITTKIHSRADEDTENELCLTKACKLRLWKVILVMDSFFLYAISKKRILKMTHIYLGFWNDKDVTQYGGDNNGKQ